VQVKDLEERLETRKLVERAKGILMNEHGYDEAAAFKQLQKWSMDRRMSLKDVAEVVVNKLG
jgi:response regulator NasT